MSVVSKTFLKMWAYIYFITFKSLQTAVVNVLLCASVSSLRSADSPSLFLALVVCGDGHCWCRGHGCAHGCLRGQAAAKGDKIWVRRQFCAMWVEGRDSITVPNQSL